MIKLQYALIFSVFCSSLSRACAAPSLKQMSVDHRDSRFPSEGILMLMLQHMKEHLNY